MREEKRTEALTLVLCCSSQARVVSEGHELGNHCPEDIFYHRKTRSVFEAEVSDGAAMSEATSRGLLDIALCSSRSSLRPFRLSLLACHHLL